MKKTFFVMGIICALFIAACATTSGTGEGSYKPSDFGYFKEYGLYGIINFKGGIVVIPSRIDGRRVEKIIGPGPGYGSIYLFRFIKGITEITFPDTLESIGHGAFWGNKLIKVNIPESVRYIYDGAFAGNDLTEITIPTALRNIYDRVFMNNKLTSVSIPEGVIVIGTRAFADNELTEINIANTVTSIGAEAFRNNKLTSVELPTGLTELGLDAFAENNFAEPFILPDTVKRIPIICARESFWNEKYSDYVYINSLYGMIMGTGESRTITMTNSETGTSKFSGLSVRTITIPSAMYGIPVTRIAQGFFSGNSGGSGLTAFIDRDKNRKKVDLLVLPANLSVIEPGAFAFCDIARVTAPNAAVQAVWDDYIRKQKEADEVVYTQGYNLTTSQMEQMFR